MSDDARIPDDEIVSAVLDGEASPEEVERVASDPVLSARLEQMRQVSAVVGEPVTPLDELSRRRLVDRALDAAALPGTPGSLAPPARARRFGFNPSVVGAAAAVALLALFGGLVIATGGSQDDGDSAASDGADDTISYYSADDAGTTAGGEAELFAEESADQADADSDAGGVPDAARGDDESDPPMADGRRLALGDVGDHDSAASFADAVRTVALSPAPSTTAGAESDTDPVDPQPSTAEPCAAVRDDAALALGSTEVTEVTGTLQLRDAWAAVAADGSGPVVIVLLDDCSSHTVTG